MTVSICEREFILSLLQVLRGRFLSRGDRDIQTLSFPPWVTSNLLWTHRIEIIGYSYFAKLNILQIAPLSLFSPSWMPRVHFLELCRVRKHLLFFLTFSSFEVESNLMDFTFQLHAALLGLFNVSYKRVRISCFFISFP